MSLHPDSRSRADSEVRLALDAGSGDHSPWAQVDGALTVLTEDPNVRVALVGDETAIGTAIDQRSANAHLESGRLRIVHTSSFVAEGGNPAWSVRQDSAASVSVTARLVKTGDADAALSVGNTGAALSAAVVELGLLTGVHRPMAGLIFPFAPKTFVADLGPNAGVSPRHFIQFARLATAYLQGCKGIVNPTVALVSNGREEGKGIAQVREAARVLRETDVDFIGFVEGDGIVSGAANIILMDGFVGNVVLKFLERYSLYVAEQVERLRQTVADLSQVLKPLQNLLEMYSDVTKLPEMPPILGVKGLFYLGHGRSLGTDIAAILRQMTVSVRNDLATTLNHALSAEGQANPPLTVDGPCPG